MKNRCRTGRWIKTKFSKTGEELEQRLIVTFSFKYRDYLRHVREKQIAKTKVLIDSGAAGKLGKGQNDPKRFITKTDFEARPVFLQRDDRIRAHFLTCFLALILYKYLAKKVNRGGRHFTPDEIIGTLQDMNFLSIPGEGYIPTYTRTDLTNNLHGSAGFRTDTQIVSMQKMKKIINDTKNNQAKEDRE